MPQTTGRYPRTVSWFLLLVALVVYLVAFELQVERNPLRADEVDFFQCMQNVTKLGRPLYYAGEVNLPVASLVPLGSDTLAGQPFQFYRFKPETRILKETFFAITDDNSRYTYCLWHPPLYVYLGALFLRPFDLPIAQAATFRYAHLVFVALLFGGLAALMRELYRPVWFLGLSLSILFLACSGLAIGASILVDYNGALAMCVVAWLAWAFLRADRDPRYAPLAAVLLALSFGVGLGVGLAALLGLLLWVVVFHRAAFVRHAALLLAGVALFLAAFWLAAQLGRFPFSQPFLHNFQRAELQTSLPARLAASLRYVRWYVVQIGGIAVSIALFLCGWRLFRLRARANPAGANGVGRVWADTRAFVLPTIVLVTLVSQAALSADAYGFPKYIAFAVPLLFAYVGGELAALVAGPRQRWLAVGLAALLVVSLGVQTAGMLRRPGGTLYMAGEQGFLAAADVAAATTQPGQVILSSKDIGFYAGRKFVQWSGRLLTDPALLRQRLADEQVRLVAASQAYLGSAGPAVAQWLAGNGEPVAAPGDYRLYRLR